MPMYEVKCPECGQTKSIHEGMNGDKRHTTKCPECDTLMKNQLFGGSTIVFEKKYDIPD